MTDDDAADCFDYKDNLIITIEKFGASVHRRLFSDSTTDLKRMRSIDSLLSEDGVSTKPHSQTVDIDWVNRKGWGLGFADPQERALIFVKPYTLQPVSDDACHVNCQFEVCARRLSTEVLPKPLFDPFVSDFLSRSSMPSFLRHSSEIMKNEVIGVFYYNVVLCNPLRINRHITPITSMQCSLSIDMESLDEDLVIEQAHLSILSTHSAIQCGPVDNSMFRATITNELPLTIGGFGETVIAIIEATTREYDIGTKYRAKLDIKMRPLQGRICLLSFESPFDVHSSFLPKNTDDFTISFSCKEESVRLGEQFTLFVKISNQTEHSYNLSLLFPLYPRATEKMPALRVSDGSLMSADEVMEIADKYRSYFPYFVCMESERRIGIVPRKTVFECSVQFEAVQCGRSKSIHLIQLVERREGDASDRTIDFPGILQITVTP